MDHKVNADGVMQSTQRGVFDGFDRQDPDLLRKCVRDALGSTAFPCILHPLGFYFIRILSEGPTSIRLHYWPAYSRTLGTAITPYHDHVWSLCSCVLAGELDNVLIDLIPDELGGYLIANIDQRNNADSVVPFNTRVRLETRSKIRYGANQFYEIPPRVFHFTDVPEGQATLTLVKSTVIASGGPQTLVPIGFDGHCPERTAIQSPYGILNEIDNLVGDGRK